MHLLCIGIAAGCGDSGGEVSPGMLAELTRELDRALAVSPLHLEASASRPCTAVFSLESVTLSVGCAAGGPSKPHLAGLQARAEQAIRERADPEAMHTAALINLLSDYGGGKSLQRSISSLETAARLTSRPSPVLADLAGAYLIRAERARSPRDLLLALEAAEEAVEREPRNKAALFNRALALQRFGLVEEAADGWRNYLAIDSVSAWGGEARRNLRETLAVDTPPSPPAPDASLAAYAEYAGTDPQGGRVLGWCQVLGAWAEATLAGDTARAEEQLGRAGALGSALERRAGGDATLADGVRAIRAASGDPRRLARAHREFAAGCALNDQVQFRAAAARFAAAAEASEGSPVLRSWARLLHGKTVFHGGDAHRGERIVRQVAGKSDPVRHPALAGHARLVLAAVLVRGYRSDSALEELRRAADLFVRAGERENEGVSLEGLSVAWFSLRDMDEGYTAAYRALDRLRSYRNSYRLHNLLSFTAEVVSADGFARAAICMQDEGVRVAERTGNPVYVVEARLTRARLLAASGAFARAREDVAAVRTAVERLPDPEVRMWMIAQRQMVDATASLWVHPARAAAALDSAAEFLLKKMHAPLVAFPAVVNGAHARLAAGDAAGGMARLEEALAILEQRRDSIRMEPRRAAVFEEARTLVDRVVMLKLASGRTGEALAYLDRGRASLASVGGVRSEEATSPKARLRGEVALVYALVGDTLLTWTVAEPQSEVSRTVVDTVSLVRTTERLRELLEEPATEAELRPALSQLYDLLVRPVEARLGEAETPLVIVAEGEIASLPFAALYDTRRRRYLVEAHPSRFAVSLREAWRPAGRADAAEEVVLVADPAFDPIEHPAFERLKGAADEVGEIRTGYPGARVLSDAEAHGEAFRAALRRAGMVHYAGHAVFDDERPERSYLLLAPTPGRTFPPTLEAGEIAQLDLRHLSLVVLGACQTVRTGPGRAAGFSGLAGAFLAAGARGAVGSLWEVDDRLTRPLMVEFHRAYHRFGDGPVALRQAQLRLLRSRDESLRSPSAWAAFRYAGR